MTSVDDASSQHGLKGVFVYGGCVSRDAFTELGGTVHLSGYVARQSLISAFNPPARILPVGRLKSEFQNRMLLGDIQSNLVEKIEESIGNTDAILIDLLVERLGVTRLRGGSFVTMSNELKQSKALEAVKGQTRSIRFGTDEHFELWADAATKLNEFLIAKEMKSKTLVLDTPWADRTDTGEKLKGNASMSPDEANRKYERYYDVLSNRLGLSMYRLPHEHVLSASEHRWGPAPYHYIHLAYDGIVSKVQEIMNK
jgi:hypothetical protein